MANEDLLKDTSVSYEDGNYFIVTITDLQPNQSYPIQFKWTYKDKTPNTAWSPAKIIVAPAESEPNTPNFSNSNINVTSPEKIIITWDGKSDDGATLTNYDRVDVYIDGAPFDGSKAAYSFKSPGTTTIAAPAGTYQIVLYAISKNGVKSPVSAAATSVIVTAAGTPITNPEDPDVPTIKAGLASVIVSWNGKKSGGGDLTTTGFAGAKVYIGTTSNFTPSDNNWVHTLNFANGSNQVSIGVGTVINKSTGATLAYGTPYYVKLGTINASGVTTGNYVASSPTNITVSKLPASEISTGILSADAYITAGAESGARVVLGGSTEPFIIYGTDGTTKLLDFVGGSTGTLSITGSGNFSGNLSIGSGNSIFKAEPATGIWLGNSSYASAPFSVSNNGVIKANSGTIGGWALGTTYLQNASSSPTIKIDTTGITVGATTASYLDISPSGIVHRNSDGTASGKFSLTTGSSGSLTLSGSITVTGGDAVTSSQLSSGLSGKISTGGALGDIGSGGITATYLASNAVTAIKIAADAVTETKIAGGSITTGKIAALAITSELIAANAIVADKIAANTITASKIAANTITASEIAANTITASQIAAGTITATEISSSYIYGGTINADNITSGTITGRVIKTSTSGARITMNEVANYISIYPDTTSSPGYIYGGSYGGAGALRLSSPYASGYQAAQINLYSLGASLPYVQVTADVTTFSGGISTGAGASIGSVIYANSLGTTGSGLAIYQVQSGTNAGYLKVFTSSKRFKDDITEIDSTGYIDIIDEIVPVTYKEKDNPDSQTLVGLIAEDLAKIPKMNNFVVRDSENLPLGINYDRISVALILALKEIKNKLNTIESRLDALEG